MTSSISQNTIAGRDQMSVAPESPLRRNPPQLFDVIPEVPAIPPRLDGYQRSQGAPRMVGPYQPRNGDTTPKAGPPSPRATQIPFRSSSKQEAAQTASRSDDDSDHRSSGDGSRSSTSYSYETNVTTPISSLPPAFTGKAFTKGNTLDVLREDDFEIAASFEDGNKLDRLERVSELLFSELHLQTIFNDPSLLLKFTTFLSSYRPQSVSILIYYLDATKALRAIDYANKIAKGLESLPEKDLTSISVKTANSELESKARRAFGHLAEHELPAYTAYMYVQVVKMSMMQPAAQGSQRPEQSEGFAEIFVLTDPSRHDNPIVLASEAFHQMTQYNMNYIIGRNCRFLQGPKTHASSLERIRNKVANRQEHCELILNYRRDGSPFMNLFMHAPLYDHFGKLRYFMGAQIDVSHVIEQNPELESLQRVVAQVEGTGDASETVGDTDSQKDPFQQLIETLDMEELRAVRTWEDRILQEYSKDDPAEHKPRRPEIVRNHYSALLKDGLPSTTPIGSSFGMYNNYMLVRPYPSLRILFTSPSLNLPGMVQTSIMDKLGGSSRVRYELTQALEGGREVTAKVRWTPNADNEPQDRWIFFTPLVGSKGEVGVWMAILEDDIPETMERVQSAKAPRPSRSMGTTSPIPELSEPGDFDIHEGEPQSFGGQSSHRHSRNMSGSTDLVPSFGRTSPSQRSTSGRTINTVMSDGEGEDGMQSLGDRLRKKRERDMALMVDPSRRTYKSLSPESIIHFEV